MNIVCGKTDKTRPAVHGGTLRRRFYVAYHTVYAAPALAGLAYVALGRCAPTLHYGTFFAARIVNAMLCCAAKNVVNLFALNAILCDSFDLDMLSRFESPQEKGQKWYRHGGIRAAAS
jgi:hypothetical protein